MKHGLELQHVTEPAAFHALQSEWHDVYSRARQPLFSQSFQWASCSLAMRPPEQQRGLHCIVIREAGRALLFWPFLVRREKGLWTVATPLGTHATEYSDVLIADDVANKAELIGMALDGVLGICDVVKLHRVRSDSDLYPAVRAWSQRRGDPSWLQDYGAPYVHWDGITNWEDYENSRPRDMIKDLRRRQRRLADCGAIEFARVTDGEPYRDALKWLMATKRQWAERTGAVAPHLHDPCYRGVLERIADESGPGGQTMMFVLMVGGKPIAASWDTVTDTTFESFISTYDAEYRKFAPGRILLEHILRWAFERRLGYDFRIGDEDYKFLWCNGECPVTDFEPAGTIRGRLYRKLRNIRRRREALKGSRQNDVPTREA